ncbi:hypothetical protein BGX26_005660 [Mortierella sp. AD094]|nr:hypothetical protein BGX26_005660 [Mortierella sp. AD094]
MLSYLRHHAFETKEHVNNKPRETPLQRSGTDRFYWLNGASVAERGMCTAHRSTYTKADLSAGVWDQRTKLGAKSVRGCDFLSDSGMKYFSLLDPSVGSCADDGACNSGLAYDSELDMRQKLEQSAAAMKDIVKAVDGAYGITEALTRGTVPVIPKSVSSLHYTMHTKYNETRSDVEWYSLRDGCQWLTHWSGVCESVCWQYAALYFGFAGLADDLCVLPWDIEAGTFLYHGLTLKNIIDMLCKFGPEGASAWYSYLWNAMMRSVWLQYLEKTGAEIAKCTPQASKSDILTQYQSKRMVMHAIKTRTTTGSLECCLAAVLTARGVARDDVCDCAIHDTGMAAGIAFDIFKDLQGIIQYDVTNTLAENQGNAEADSKRLVLRQTLYALVQTLPVNPLAAEVCETFIYSAALYTRFTERYRERNMSTRLESSATLRRLVDHISEKRRCDILAKKYGFGITIKHHRYGAFLS